LLKRDAASTTAVLSPLSLSPPFASLSPLSPFASLPLEVLGIRAAAAAAYAFNAIYYCIFSSRAISCWTIKNFMPILPYK